MIKLRTESNTIWEYIRNNQKSFYIDMNLNTYFTYR